MVLNNKIIKVNIACYWDYPRQACLGRDTCGQVCVCVSVVVGLTKHFLH